jgi:hypothetical protein
VRLPRRAAFEKTNKGQITIKGDSYEWVTSGLSQEYDKLVERKKKGEGVTSDDISMYVQTALDEGYLKKLDNPFAKKGDSYAKHVEEGWGKYAEPDPDLIQKHGNL